MIICREGLFLRAGRQVVRRQILQIHAVVALPPTDRMPGVVTRAKSLFEPAVAGFVSKKQLPQGVEPLAATELPDLDSNQEPPH